MTAKREPKPAEHVVLVTGGVACLHCGVREDFGLPARVEVIVFQTKSFGELHARCERRGDNALAKPASLAEWYRSPYCGISSATIAHVLGGGRLIGSGGFGSPDGADAPYDPADFERCRRVVDMFPGWRARLGEVADRYPIWRGIVDAWDELVALLDEERPSGQAPKLYARIKQLRADARATETSR